MINTNNVLNFIYVLDMIPNFFESADIDERIDIDVLTATIIARCGTLLPLHSNFDVFKILSDNWFKRKKYNISKMLDTLYFDYNPIENYNRIESINESESGGNSENTESDYGSVVSANGNTNGSNENTTSAFNTFTYQPESKSVSISDFSSSQKTNDLQSINKKANHTRQNDITRKTQGNIGVTTSQQMIEQERQISTFNIYEWIAVQYEAEFFICIA